MNVNVNVEGSAVIKGPMTTDFKVPWFIKSTGEVVYLSWLPLLGPSQPSPVWRAQGNDV